ncbi:hypothetical protein DKL51_23285, partial [Micromonospora globispora]
MVAPGLPGRHRSSAPSDSGSRTPLRNPTAPCPLTKAIAVPVAYPSLRRRPPLPDVVPAVGALLLLAGVVGLVPPLAALAFAVAAGSTLACARLLGLATGAQRSGPSAGAVRLPRRTVTLLDAAVLAAGLAVAVLPLTRPAHRLPLVLAGLAVVVPLYAEGLLRLPRRSRLSGPERLRRVVDVTGLGTSLVFASAVLLPPGEVPPAAPFRAGEAGA